MNNILSMSFAAGVWGMDFHRLKENRWIAATVLLSFFSKFCCCSYMFVAALCGIFLQLEARPY